MMFHDVLHGEQMLIGAAGPGETAVHVAREETVEDVVTEVFDIAVKDEMAGEADGIELTLDETPTVFIASHVDDENKRAVHS